MLHRVFKDVKDEGLMPRINDSGGNEKHATPSPDLASNRNIACYNVSVISKPDRHFRFEGKQEDTAIYFHLPNQEPHDAHALISPENR